MEIEQDILNEEKLAQELESYQENQINWLPDDTFFNTWDGIKGHMKKMWGHKTEFIEANWKKFFLAHSLDKVVGRPQLIDNVQKTLPLIRVAVNKNKDKESEGGEIEIQSFYFFDEKFDKRHDGFQKDCFNMDFYIYKITSPEDKDYFIYTKEKLPNCACTFHGMLVELDDFAELSRNLKVKSVSKIFFLKSYEPDVKLLAPEKLVEFTKERQINEKDWAEFLGFHPFGTINKFVRETEYLKSAWLLSSKIDDYPLHLSVIGMQGTKKSKGLIEATAFKFNESFSIYEGGNSRLKGLAPSFKEKPANLGYLAKSERVGFIDEIGKMVEQRMNQDNLSGTNLLGELNFLLDHSDRVVGSGNDNDIRIKATAKFMFVSNPVKNKPTIYSHVAGVYDPTFMSRILWWVQDNDEREFLLSDQSIDRSSDETLTSPMNVSFLIENRKKDIVLKKCYRKVGSISEFLTLFDTCNSFLCPVNFSKVKALADEITFLAREPMKSVWKPRAEHHVALLIDGLCKHRCLFKDYDSTFTPKPEDYELAERILIRMVKSWDTDLSPKEEYR